MTSTVHYCDRCGSKIVADRSLLILECGPSVPWAVDTAVGKPSLDLCPGCLSALCEWLKASGVASRDAGRVTDEHPQAEAGRPWR
jgi:hypothetical protein